MFRMSFLGENVANEMFVQSTKLWTLHFFILILYKQTKETRVLKP